MTFSGSGPRRSTTTLGSALTAHPSRSTLDSSPARSRLVPSPPQSTHRRTRRSAVRGYPRYQVRWCFRTVGMDPNASLGSISTVHPSARASLVHASTDISSSSSSSPFSMAYSGSGPRRSTTTLGSVSTAHLSLDNYCWIRLYIVSVLHCHSCTLLMNIHCVYYC